MPSSGHPRWHRPGNLFFLRVSPPLFDRLVCRSMVNSFFRYKNCSVYEIYPQSETPHLTQIAHLDFDHFENPSFYLLPGTVIWYRFYADRIVFRVWDYRLNHSINFSVDVDVDKFERRNLEVYFILSKVLKLASNSLIHR